MCETYCMDVQFMFDEMLCIQLTELYITYRRINELNGLTAENKASVLALYFRKLQQSSSAELYFKIPHHKDDTQSLYCVSLLKKSFLYLVTVSNTIHNYLNIHFSITAHGT